jgi:hypothetical protein
MDLVSKSTRVDVQRAGKVAHVSVLVLRTRRTHGAAMASQLPSPRRFGSLALPRFARVTLADPPTPQVTATPHTATCTWGFQRTSKPKKASRHPCWFWSFHNLADGWIVRIFRPPQANASPQPVAPPPWQPDMAAAETRLFQPARMLKLGQKTQFFSTKVARVSLAGSSVKF